VRAPPPNSLNDTLERAGRKTLIPSPALSVPAREKGVQVDRHGFARYSGGVQSADGLDGISPLVEPRWHHECGPSSLERGADVFKRKCET